MCASPNCPKDMGLRREIVEIGTARNSTPKSESPLIKTSALLKKVAIHTIAIRVAFNVREVATRRHHSQVSHRCLAICGSFKLARIIFHSLMQAGNENSWSQTECGSCFAHHALFRYSLLRTQHSIPQDAPFCFAIPSARVVLLSLGNRRACISAQQAATGCHSY